MRDDGLLFVEALEEHIRAWEEAAKLCDKSVLSVELGGAARHSAQEHAEKYRGRIAELRELIRFLRNGH
jgi:hypothetical protein